VNALNSLSPINDVFARASASQLASIEAAIGVALPDAYAAFVSEYGASAFFEADAVVATLSGDEEMVFTFFDAAKVLDDIRSHDDFAAKKLVPFADDMFNNRYVLNGADNWSAHFIAYDAGTARVSRVADSFAGFLSRLTLRPHSI
jgi:hypothetical protein